MGIISKSMSEGHKDEETTEYTPKKKKKKSQNLGAEALWCASTSRVGTGCAGSNTGKSDLSVIYCTTICHEYALVLNKKGCLEDNSPLVREAFLPFHVI